MTAPVTSSTELLRILQGLPDGADMDTLVWIVFGEVPKEDRLLYRKKINVHLNRLARQGYLDCIWRVKQ